jgi:hypothetical protein
MSEHQMTEAQATEEALLLITRKLQRMAPDAFAKAWGQLPDGAKVALGAAESRADLLRNTNTVTWPAQDED